MLRERFARARVVGRPIVLGPLAVDAARGAEPPRGLLVAGDAAGFVDPMTGDGLRFALRGGELAAHAALRVLEHGWDGVHASLAETRRREFGGKWRFNRILRGLVGSSLGVRGATMGGRLAPAAVRALIHYASDCGLAARTGQA
jgi:menaquinone-9 beta-reductase